MQFCTQNCITTCRQCLSHCLKFSMSNPVAMYRTFPLNIIPLITALLCLACLRTWSINSTALYMVIGALPLTRGTATVRVTVWTIHTDLKTTTATNVESPIAAISSRYLHLYSTLKMEAVPLKFTYPPNYRSSHPKRLQS
jgi:hypothetical protein